VRAFRPPVPPGTDTGSCPGRGSRVEGRGTRPDLAHDLVQFHPQPLPTVYDAIGVVQTKTRVELPPGFGSHESRQQSGDGIVLLRAHPAASELGDASSDGVSGVAEVQDWPSRAQVLVELSRYLDRVVVGQVHK